VNHHVARNEKLVERIVELGADLTESPLLLPLFAPVTPNTRIEAVRAVTVRHRSPDRVCVMKSQDSTAGDVDKEQVLAILLKE
jgi:hypothetical protein